MLVCTSYHVILPLPPLPPLMTIISVLILYIMYGDQSQTSLLNLGDEKQLAEMSLGGRQTEAK